MSSRLVISPLLWPYGTLAFLLTLRLWPAWIDGERLVIGGDALYAHYPWFVLWRDLLAAGEPPFWNPYTFGGLPSLPTLQSGFGYPPHWLVTWLAPVRAMNWMVGLHVVLAGLGTAWCAGRLGASPSGQVLSGASFALGSALAARLWAGHLSFIEANAWLPIATGLAVEVGRRRRVAWLALTVAMLALAGQPEVLIFSLWWLPLWAGVAAWHGPDRRPLRAVARATLAVGLGAALAAFQLLPVLELLRVSNRLAGMGWDFQTSISLPPWHLLTAVVPYLYGDPRGSYWPGPSYEWHERLLYVGVVPLLAAGLARGRWRWLCWGAVLLAIALSLGRYLPGYGLVLSLPGYATFRIPSKHLVLAALALALAAGLGLEHLHGRRLARLASVGAIAVAVATFGAASWLPSVAVALANPDRLGDVTVLHGFVGAATVGLGWGAATLAAVAAFALLPPIAARRGMLLLALVELCLVLRPYYLSPADPAGLLAAVQPVAGHSRAVIIGPHSAPLANHGPVVKVEQPAGYMPLFSAGYMQLATGAISPGPIVAIAREDDPAIILLGYNVIFDQQRGRVTLVEPPLPDAWVARCAWPGGALEARLAVFPGSECVTRPMATVAEEVTPPGPATILDAGPGRLTVQAEGPGWLATRQPWYPGWVGHIDGVEAPVEILNGALVGIQLPAGSHTVTLRYWPAGLSGGLVVSGAAALVLLAAWWADRRPGRPPSAIQVKAPSTDVMSR